MSKLMDRLKKTNTIKIASVLSESEFFNDVDETSTDYPAINIALSGTLDGGLKSGIMTIAGASRNFKSMYGLLMAAAYLKKNKEAALLFYDSEFGTPTDYFSSVGIDTARVLHVPVKNLEELKFDIMQQLEATNKGDKLFILIDSIGNLASLKEANDALDGKSVADMGRAKYLKSLYRIITPYLRTKDIPLVQIGHTYNTMDLFPKAILSGGSGLMLASDLVWMIGRSQEKDGSELAGYNFTIKIEKSRYVREKSAIPITVKFEGGISKYSGMLDIALELGAVIKPSNGWFSPVNMTTGEINTKKYRRADTESDEFWCDIINNQTFKDKIAERYKVSGGSLTSVEETDQE